MPTSYESVAIFTSQYSAEEVNHAIGEYRKLLNALGASIVHEEFWGLKQLAYPIEKQTTGYYWVVEYTGNGNVVEKLELALKRDENALRFLTTRLDKYAVKYNEDRRNGIVGPIRRKAAQDAAAAEAAAQALAEPPRERPTLVRREKEAPQVTPDAPAVAPVANDDDVVIDENVNDNNDNSNNDANDND
ncbi:MAG: 30S ribosomal protein S6 [Sphingobacteriales bacterium]|jgi:small subunit ribosomal protein S6|nr:30S ribosomal protein S6 [Sphingobacteriales bacterium]MBP9141189.1 30S ribosomal protein S6 [Chitinophagales bacterium]MDA0198135.1 30S ribosomal protein S6 [Bacteroidota bacterium]MBK6889279.1 30S ribosomal protein S6 [Sphingobacteriales bacterium]MBK7528222.1 30S ribosomal protein S6 [Sphingobacteriales bacterium]